LSLLRLRHLGRAAKGGVGAPIRMANFVNAAVNWAGRMVTAYKAGPPKVYNPEYYTWKAWMTKWSEVSRENGGGMDGFWVTFNKARIETVFRKGTLVGTDGNGNKYYEDNSVPYGRTRWVEYPTPPGVFGIELRVDPSMISPEWHGWMHYMHDKTGPQLAGEFEKPFKQEMKISQGCSGRSTLGSGLGRSTRRWSPGSTSRRVHAPTARPEGALGPSMRRGAARQRSQATRSCATMPTTRRHSTSREHGREGEMLAEWRVRGPGHSPWLAPFRKQPRVALVVMALVGLGRRR